MLRPASLLFAILLCPAMVEAQLVPLGRPAPTTRPAFGKPVTELAKVREAFVALMSPDPVQRAKARDQLLRLEYNDLPTLAAVARQFKPLPPTLVSMLKPIVIQVHATGEPYEKEPAGFLGITMASDRLDPNAGILVETRMLGFVAASVLEDGDLILNVEERPLAPHRMLESFQQVIRETKPGQTVHLKVLRRGQIVRIPTTLSARLVDRSGGDPGEYKGQVDELIYRRNLHAESYWTEVFAPLTTEASSNTTADARP